MVENFKHKRYHTYAYRSRTLFRALRNKLLAEEKPIITRDFSWEDLYKLCDKMNALMADYYVNNQYLRLPYIGEFFVYEWAKYYNPKTGRTNMPILWNLTRKLKLSGELGSKGQIVNTNIDRHLRAHFAVNHVRRYFRLRINQKLTRRAFKYVNENNVPLNYYERQWLKKSNT